MGKTSKNLWPANTASPDIDISYYKSLPNVPYIEGAKDDVKAYIIGLDYKDLYTHIAKSDITHYQSSLADFYAANAAGES